MESEVLGDTREELRGRVIPTTALSHTLPQATTEARSPPPPPELPEAQGSQQQLKRVLACSKADVALRTTPPAKKSKQVVRKARAIVQSIELSHLVSSYHKHYAKYSEGRSKVTQKVPSAVWKLVYSDFLAQLPDSHFAEDTLKDRLRETLLVLETGTSDDKGAETAVLQPETVLQELRTIDSPTAHNVLRRRQEVVDRHSPTAGSSDATFEQHVEIVSQVQSKLGEEHDHTMSKQEILQELARLIAAMAAHYQGSHGTRDAYYTAKMDAERKKASMFTQKEKSLRLADLFRLKEVGVYTEEEFISECRRIMSNANE